MSTLTVPKAPISGGRAAQVRVEGSQNGAIVAQFGEKMREVGSRMETDRLSTEMGRAQIEMTQSLGNLRLKYSQESDPDAIDQGWTSESAGLREAILSRYDAKISDNVGLAFDELSVRHSLALGGRAIELRGDRARATATSYGETVIQQAAVSDQGTRDAMMDQYSDMLDRNVSAGYLDREAALADLRSFGSDMEGVAASRMLTDNPQGLLDGLEAGEYTALDAQKRETYRTRALAAVESAAKADATEADRLAKQRNTEIGDQLKDIRDIARSGRNWAGEVEFLSNPDVQANPEFAEAEAAVILRDGKPGFARLTVAEMNEQITAEQNRPVGEKFEVRVLDAMVSVRDAAVEGWRTDPYSYAEEVGLPVPDALPDITAADPNDFVTALRQRRSYAVSMSGDDNFLEKPVFFSEAEKVQLTESASVASDVETRTALASAMAGVFGSEYAGSAFKEIGAGTVFAHVGGLLANGANPALAKEIFTGQQVLLADTADPVTAKIRSEQAFKEFGEMFVGKDILQAQLMATADALYAARDRLVDPSKAFRQEEIRYRQALHEAAGGTGEYKDKDNARGGIQEVFDVETILPIGVRPQDVEDGFSAALEMFEATTDASGITASLSGNPLQTAPWLAASVSGGAPAVAGVPLSTEDLQKVYIVASSSRSYTLMYETNTGPKAVGDSKTGAAYHFDLVKFLREVNK